MCSLRSSTLCTLHLKRNNTEFNAYSDTNSYLKLPHTQAKTTILNLQFTTIFLSVKLCLLLDWQEYKIMTEERIKKLKRVIGLKQPTLGLVLENIHDHHNISAVLRSCDAVGVKDVYIISPKDKTNQRLGKKSSASASKWLDIHLFFDVETCYAALRERYDKIFVTHLNSEASSIYDIDFTQSVALVFGNEHDGISEEARALADGNFIIPQVGLIQSLNISVACAVSLYEAHRQRTAAGMFETPQMSSVAQEKMLADWMER